MYNGECGISWHSTPLLGIFVKYPEFFKKMNNYLIIFYITREFKRLVNF